MNAEFKSTLRWTRSDDAIIGGVAKGLARTFDLEPWLVRVVFLILGAMGFGIILYFMFLISLPKESDLGATDRKMILGVCLELHKRGHLELGLARFIALGLLVLSWGSALVGYLILYVVFKEQKRSP